MRDLTRFHRPETGISFATHGDMMGIKTILIFLSELGEDASKATGYFEVKTR
jgi:hypothetical protein